MKKALAFDIGGTKIYSTVVDETGKIISKQVKILQVNPGNQS